MLKKQIAQWPPWGLKEFKLSLSPIFIGGVGGQGKTAFEDSDLCLDHIPRSQIWNQKFYNVPCVVQIIRPNPRLSLLLFYYYFIILFLFYYFIIIIIFNLILF